MKDRYVLLLCYSSIPIGIDYRLAISQQYMPAVAVASRSRNLIPDRIISLSEPVTHISRQPIDQMAITTEIGIVLKSVRQRKISTKLLLLRLYLMVRMGTCLTHFRGMMCSKTQLFTSAM